MSAATLASAFILSKEALFRDLAGEAVILDLGSGTYFGLNHVGTRIWQLVARDGRLDAVFDALCQEYEAPPAEIERDLVTLITRLADARLGEIV